MMLEKFRNCYPQGSLVSELIDIDRGLYIVKVSVQIDGVILTTGLAAADTVEIAEDRARERAISTLKLELPAIQNPASSVTTSEEVTLKNGSKQQNYAPRDNLSVPQVSTSAVESESTPEPTVSDTVENQTIEDPVTDDFGNLFAGTYDPQAAETAIAVESEEVSTQPPVDDSIPDTTVKIDFYAVKHETDIELQRLGWTSDEGRNFLIRQYGKPSRLRLTDEELLQFLQHLKSLPTPE